MDVDPLDERATVGMAALRAAGVPSEEIDTFSTEATSGDHDHLLHTTMDWVDWT
jgi:hypothetical protein